MLQVRTDGPFAVEIAVFPDRSGVDTLIVCVKTTFDLHPAVTAADKQRAVEKVDRYRDASLLLPGELHLPKSGTDVVLCGHAYAPNTGATQSAVSVRVDDRRHLVAVFGDRRWERLGLIGDPRPFERMPLVYERAFGGPNSARNPVGVGISDELDDPLPNLELHDALLESPDDDPAPANFGPVAPWWEPRVRCAGTYDEHWVRHRAPYLPEDFDAEFFRVAPRALALDRFLEGGEPVEVIGASPRGVLRFDLPSLAPQVRVDFGAHNESPRARLETVAIFPDDNALTMTWKASLNCDRRVLDVERVGVREAA